MSFSPKQFREALQDSSKLSQKFQKYVQIAKKHQIDAVYYMIEEFYKIFMEKETPLIKTNAIFALKMILETCQYPVVQMTEAFLLSQIQEIALYQSDKRTYGKTSQYFKEKGYPGSIPNLEQLSHNYVTYATYVIFLAASIKQHVYFYTDRLMTPSGFQVIAKKLKEKKVEVPPETVNSQWKEKYEANLNIFGTTSEYEATYLNFFKEKVERYLVEGGKARQILDFRKILRNGDCWLTSQILGCLNESLEADSFQVRRYALGLLNQLFLGGDIEAVIIVNEDEVVEKIVDRILEVKGSSDIGRGAQIYPEIAGQLEQKKNFYIEFLRCIQNWAKLMPTSLYLGQEEESKMSKLLRRLKQRQFIFPSNEMFPKHSKEFNENMQKNKQRNNYIIRTLNEGESERDRSLASNRLSKYSNKISLIKEMRESTILTVPEIQKLIEDTEVALKDLPKNEWDIMKNMKTIKYFSDEFQKKFQLIEESISEQKLEAVYVRGLKCLQKIEEIGPYYEDYKTGKIDFKKFSDQIAVKCEQIDKSKSRVSDILSRLSKSKDVSRSGLDLSRSLHAIKQRQSMKPDHILEKSVNMEQVISHNTKTLTNLSNLEDDPLPENKVGSRSSKVGSRSSKLGSHSSKVGSGSSKVAEKEEEEEPIKHQSSKISKEEKSIVSQSSVVSNQKEPIVQKYETAKFVAHDEYEIRPSKVKKSSIAEEPSRHESKASNLNQSRPSAHFNQVKSPPSKAKQYFQEDSSWSSEEERKNVTSNPKSSKIKESQEGLNSDSRKANITDQKSKTQTRQIFSDSSFSKYDDSNEELRDVIDKSDNPDFRMVFNNKQPSQNSKMSKNTLKSHEHYAAVLQSLAPKSIDPEREISHFSRDKSTSQLPPKSQLDNSSRMDQRMNLTGASRFKDKTIIHQENEEKGGTSNILKKSKSSVKNSIVSSNKSSLDVKQPSKVIPRESEKMKASQGSKLKQSSSNYKGNSVEGEKSNLKSEINQSQPSEYSQNVPHPYYETNGQVISVRRSNHSHSKRQSSKIIIQDKQSDSKISKRQYPLKNQAKNDFQKLGNQYYHGGSHPQTMSGLDVIKVGKVKEIEQLQRKIQQLKEEEKHLFLVRSQWQSPTRPQTLRTAVSPRFRNNITNYTQSTQTFKRAVNQTSPSRRGRQLNRSQQMNFDLSQKFKPPEGELIYRRLFKRDLSQLDKHEKRKILKGKQLVFRNDDIEVGMMIHKSSRDLKVVYYVTASRYLKTFLFKVESNPKLVVHAIPNALGTLQPRKQYRIYLFAEVLQFPYKLPEIHFKYHPELLSLQENLFESNEVNYFTSLVPFFFLKFFTLKPVNIGYMTEQWGKDLILRSDETNYSRRVLPKHFFILQYFPDLINLESSEYQTVYGMQCQYGSTRFLMKIIIKINRFFYVQGMLTAFREKENSEKIMQFAIACLTILLEKSERELI